MRAHDQVDPMELARTRTAPDAKELALALSTKDGSAETLAVLASGFPDPNDEFEFDKLDAFLISGFSNFRLIIVATYL